MHTMTAYLSKIIEWVVCATAVIAIYAPIAILMNNNEQKKKKRNTQWAYSYATNSMN